MPAKEQQEEQNVREFAMGPHVTGAAPAYTGEGVSVLQLIKRINRVPAFSIYVTNPRRSSSKMLERLLSAYEAEFSPSAKANLMVKVEN